MKFHAVMVLLLALAGSGCAQFSPSPSTSTPGPPLYYCCYDDYCDYSYYPCPYTVSTSTYPPLGQASSSANSFGNNPSGQLNLGNVAVAGFNQTVGFNANSVSQNNASGPAASVSSNVQASATNTNVTNPIVSTNAGAGSNGNAALGAVNNLDQATSNGNMTSSVASGQSLLYGNGTALNGNSNASASASQRSKKLKTSQPKKLVRASRKTRPAKVGLGAGPGRAMKRARRPSSTQDKVAAAAAKPVKG